MFLYFRNSRPDYDRANHIRKGKETRHPNRKIASGSLHGVRLCVYVEFFSPLFGPFRNGFSAVLWRGLHVMLKRSKVPLTKNGLNNAACKHTLRYRNFSSIVIAKETFLEACLHVAFASASASTFASSFVLSQWLTQQMGFRPILCVCLCITISTMLKLTQTLKQMQTLRVNRALMVYSVFGV